MAEPGAAPSKDAPRAPSVWSDAAHLFALCGLAIAQPLFDLLGKNPTFFVAHDLDGGDVVVLALLVLFVPPLVLFAVLTATRFASPLVARITRAALAGLLIALTIVPPLERAIGFSTAAWIIAMVVLAVGAALAYDRLRPLRLFLTYLSPAPILFLVIFLLLTPVHTLVFASDPAAAAIDLQGTRTPVVVLVFDEFPLGVLLDENGGIDAEEFPGFARLASISNWYANATTVSGQTLRAVPSILTGVRHAEDSVPIAAESPHSLFTLFGRSHDMHVTEPVTRLCPTDLCGERRGAADSASSLASDLRTVYWHTLLPEDTANDWGIPPIGDRWAGFTDEPQITTAPTNGTEQDRIDAAARALDTVDSVAQEAEFGRFLESFGTGNDPGLYFLHVLLPHVPYALLPDGQGYNYDYVPQQSFNNPTDAELVEVDGQRLVLQALAVDKLVDRMLDRLERTGLLDDALVAVIADHGSSLAPGEGRRDVDDAASRDGTMPVPLFVHTPGQEKGTIDDREALTIDLLPTIADALGVDLPKAWDFEGRSLLTSKPGAPRALKVDEFDISEPPVVQRFADALAGYLYRNGDPRDPYRIGPFGDLVGSALTDLQVGSAVGNATIDGGDAYANVDLGGTLPVMLQATVTGVGDDEWLAVVVNGTVAGIGPTFPLDTRTRFVAMFDPSLLKSGANTVALYRIDADRTLHELRG